MKRQKKRSAHDEYTAPTALSAGLRKAGTAERAKESHDILGFRPAGRRHDWLYALLLVVITIIAYLPVCHAGFIWDDDSFLTANPVIKSARGLYQIWFTASTPDYFPMTSSMLWLEWRIWGNNPLGYHLVNVLLHGLSAVLLWRVLQGLKIPGALLAAGIFALHPVNVESVAWITERKNTLCMLFYAGALLAWLKFEDSGWGRWYGLALGGFALALLSKTAVAPLPLVLLGMAWWRRGRVEWKDVRRVVPFFMLAAVLGLVTVWFQSHMSIGHDVVRTDGFPSRLAGAGWAVWFYLYKALVPLGLVFLYPRWQIDGGNVLSYFPLVLLAVALGLCWSLRRSWGKGLFFGLAYFVVMLLPILGFLNIYFMRYSLVADHWEYFAIIGPIALAAALIRKPFLAALVLLALGALTWKQCGMYASDETVWQTTVRLNPKCFLAYLNLGVDLDEQGKMDEAISDYLKALQIKPDCADAYTDLGIALGQKGKVNEAIASYQQALNIKPDYAEARNNLGNALLETGRVDEAIVQYQETLKLRPDDAAAHLNLGIALLRKERVNEAMAHFRNALQIKPNFAAAYDGLGNAFLQQGKVEDEIIHYQKALEINPDCLDAQKDLAWVLATCPQAALRNGSKALELAQKANSLAGETDPAVLRILAAAFAETGRYSKAVEIARNALRLAEAQSNTNLSGQLKEQLEFYQAGRPYHSPEPVH